MGAIPEEGPLRQDFSGTIEIRDGLQISSFAGKLVVYWSSPLSTIVKPLCEAFNYDKFYFAYVGRYPVEYRNSGAAFYRKEHPFILFTSSGKSVSIGLLSQVLNGSAIFVAPCVIRELKLLQEKFQNKRLSLDTHFHQEVWEAFANALDEKKK